MSRHACGVEPLWSSCKLHMRVIRLARIPKNFGSGNSQFLESTRYRVRMQKLTHSGSMGVSKLFRSEGARKNVWAEKNIMLVPLEFACRTFR